MDPLSFSHLIHQWGSYTIELVPRVVVVMAAASFVFIRFEWVRSALMAIEKPSNKFPKRELCFIAIIFGVFGIVGTHSSIMVDVKTNEMIASLLDFGPKEEQCKNPPALIGFRDSVAMSAGLVGGPWIGFISGAISGFERSFLGGFANYSSGIATALLGLFSGLAMRLNPIQVKTLGGTLLVALFGTLLQRVLLWFLANDKGEAINMAYEILPTVALVNCLGCMLFIWLYKDMDRESLEKKALRQENTLLNQETKLRDQKAQLERDRNELEKKELELCVLRAQVVPHDLNNTLNTISGLIALDQKKASECVIKLANFYKETLNYASKSIIPLRDELKLLQLSHEIMQVRYPNKFAPLFVNIPESLFDCLLPPHSLVILAHNALTHGMKGASGNFHLEVLVDAVDLGDIFEISVTDNGCGIEQARREKLGKSEVDSTYGNGKALYNLSKSLEYAFHGKATLSFHSMPKGTKVILSLPKRKREI